MVDMAHIAGLVAGGVHPSPVPHAHVVTTTTHKTLRGPRGGMILCTADLAQAVDRAVFPGTQGGPLMHVIAAKAVALREAMRPEFSRYAQRIVDNARTMADQLEKEGLRIVSGGTDTHLMLVDLRPVGLTGKTAEKALEAAGITVNKNLIPYDTQPPMVTSGIRIGTPAMTTRGMGPTQFEYMARLIRRVLRAPDDADVLRAVRGAVRELCVQFPVPILGTRE
jgi:glycine hydroxymethyltransferase